MFDIGWAELVIIGVVALIVIGPRDLPEMFRTLGRFTGKLRAMSRDFQRAMETAANESGVKDVARDLKSATSAKSMGLDAVKDAATKFERWDPLKQKSPAPPKPAMPIPTPPAETIAAPPGMAQPSIAQPAMARPAPLGPETQALADKAAARRAIAQEAAEKLRAVNSGAVPVVPPDAPANKPGRVRKKSPAATPVTASVAAKPAPAPKPAKSPRAKTIQGDA